MKRSLLPIVILLILTLCLAACAEKPTPVGEYKFLSASVVKNGITLEYSVGDKIIGKVEISEDDVTLSVKKDGTYDFESVLPVYSFRDEGTWEAKGDIVVFHSSKADLEAVSDGDDLTLDYTDDGGKTRIHFAMRRE